MQRGISLIAMSFFLIGVGLFTLPAMQLYKTRQAYERQDVTQQKIKDIQLALQKYRSQNGFYPCPAPIDAAIDTPTFGVSVADDCRTPVAPAPVAAGTFRTIAVDGVSTVRTGALPVRTLGLSDAYIYDGYDKRYVYAVTETHAVRGVRPPAQSGAIQIVDGLGNNATAEIGNIVEIVYSMGMDDNGAYDKNGTLIQRCDPAALSGQNCDYAVNAVFRNSTQKSTDPNAANKFTTVMSYAPDKDPVPCEQAMGANGPPNNMTFLVDTSGSMAGEGTPDVQGSPLVACPPGLEGNCTRMDVAHWAMRRALPVRLGGDRAAQPIGQTNFTGFRCFGQRNDLADCAGLNPATFGRASNGSDQVEFNGSMLFDDPANQPQPDPETVANRLEPILEQTCPRTNTPLGTHMRVLAEQLGNGVPGRPNRITVISDGEDNVLPVGCGAACPTLVDIARDINQRFPLLEIDIIDVSDNPALEQVAVTTGGRYFPTNNPDQLLNALFAAMGVCRPRDVPRPRDQLNCDRPPPPAPPPN